MKHYQLMRKASINSLVLAIAYALMSVIAFRSDVFAGLVGIFVSAIFYREFQQMKEAAKEIKKKTDEK